MNDPDWQLHHLIQATCQHPLGSLERRQGLNRVIGMIQRSRKLLRDSVPEYEDALQQTWIYFCRNLCEAGTGQAYDPALASVTTWLNAYLKRRLQDCRQEQAIALKQQATKLRTESGEILDPVDQLPSRPVPPPLLEDIQDWVKMESKQLRRIHIRDHLDVNCQVLILRRLPPETSWERLSQEFNLPIATLSSFYQRECLPRLLTFGKSQGYL